MPGDGTAYVARLCEILHGSMTPESLLWDMSLADGIRLLNLMHLDSSPKAKLRSTRAIAKASVRGLF